MNSRHVVAVTVGALCMATALGAAQDAPEFDFVSLRRSPPVAAAPAANASGTAGTRDDLRVLPDGRFEARGQTLANLARVAFGFEDADPNNGVVKVASDWMWTDRFDVTASAGRPWTTPPPATRVPAELRVMLRVLLDDRFALRARIATNKVNVMAVRLAKEEKLGPNLRPSAAECRGPFTEVSADATAPKPRCPYTFTGSEIHAEAVTMTEVAQLLSRHFLFRGRGLLVDQTRLPGLYDLSFVLPLPQRSNRTVGMMDREFEAQVGLTLKPASVPLPTLIIEKARQPRED